MCSRKCDTPDSVGISSREPVLTKKPTATERADGLISPTMVRPLARTCLWNDINESPKNSGTAVSEHSTALNGEPQGILAQRDDRKIARRVFSHVGEYALGRQSVDRAMDFFG